MQDWIFSVIDRLGPVGVGFLIALENLIPPIPSEPASIPTTRNNSAIGTPVRCEARLNTTLTPSNSPQVARRSAVA